MRPVTRVMQAQWLRLPEGAGMRLRLTPTLKHAEAAGDSQSPVPEVDGGLTSGIMLLADDEPLKESGVAADTELAPPKKRLNPHNSDVPAHVSAQEARLQRVLADKTAIRGVFGEGLNFLVSFRNP
ncbi:hypothetical protein B0H14DRAFT_2574574 [Mycena olivaceomarginata]|nr:hypothetical protein B0H14DRAFT_2574574 [Mycena olivaceomarginata]